MQRITLGLTSERIYSADMSNSLVEFITYDIDYFCSSLKFRELSNPGPKFFFDCLCWILRGADLHHNCHDSLQGYSTELAHDKYQVKIRRVRQRYTAWDEGRYRLRFKFTYYC